MTTFEHAGRLVIALGASLALVAPAGARQVTPPPRPSASAPATAPQPANPARTIVRRDAQGQLIRLDITPEEAALALLEIDPATRQKIDTILAERAKTWDKIVAENPAILARMVGARSTSKQEFVAALGDFLALLKPLSSRGKLRDELAAALPPEPRSRFEYLLNEYRDAAIAQGAKEDGAGTVDGPRRRGYEIRETLLIVGQEFKRSCDRQLVAHEDAFKTALTRVGLSAAQESGIKAIFAELAAQPKDQSAPDRHRAAVLAAFNQLRPPQRAVVLRDVLTGAAG